MRGPRKTFWNKNMCDGLRGRRDRGKKYSKAGREGIGRIRKDLETLKYVWGTRRGSAGLPHWPLSLYEDRGVGGDSGQAGWAATGGQHWAL